MKQDPSTFQHAQARMREMLTTAINSEREHFIQDLAAEVSLKESEIAALSEELDGLQSKLTHTSKTAKKKLKNINEQLQVEVDGREQAEKLVEELKVQIANSSADHQKEKILRDDEKRKLQETIMELNHKIQAISSGRQSSVSEVNMKTEILEERIRSQNVLFSEKESQRIAQLKLLESDIAVERDKVLAVEKEKQLVEKRLEACMDENKAILRQLSEGKLDIETELRQEIMQLEGDLKAVKELLSRSEVERLELRQKYIAVGSKVEELLMSEAAESDEIIKSLKLKLKEQKSKFIEELKRTKVSIKSLHEKNAELEKNMDKKEFKLHESEVEVRTIREKLTVLEGQVAEARQERDVVIAARKEHIAELEAARRSIGSLSIASERLKEREDELHKMRIRFEERVAEIARDAKVAVQEEAKKRDALIVTHEEQVKLLQDEIAVLKEELKEEGIKHMREAAALSTKQEALALAEDDKLRANFEHQVNELKATHISREAHEQILKSRLAEESSRYSEKLQDITVKHEADIFARLKDLEDRKQKDYALAMLNIRQGIKKLEEQLIQERESRQEIEAAFDDERKSSIATLKRIEDLETNRITLASHIEKGNNVITKLKGMLKDATHNKSQSEKEIEELRKRLGEIETGHQKHIEAMVVQHDNFIKNMEKEFSDRNKEKVDLYTGMIAQLEVQVKELQQDKKKTDQSIESVRIEVTESTERASALRLSNDSLTTRLTEATIRLKELEKEKDTIARRLEEVMSTHAAQVDAMRNEERARETSLRSNHDTALVRLQSALDLSNELLTKSRENEAISSRKIDKYKTDMSVLQEKLSNSQDMTDKSDHVQDTLKRDIAELQRNHTTTVENFEAQIVKLKTRLHTAETTCQDANIAAERVRALWRQSNSKQTVKISQLQRRIVSVRESYLNIRSNTNLALSNMKSEMMQNMQNILWRQKDTIQNLKLRHENELVRVKNELITKHKQELETRIDELRGKSSEEITKEKETYSSSLSKAVKELQELRTAHDQLRNSTNTEIRELTISKDNLNHEKRALTLELDHLKADNIKFQGAIKEMELRIRSEEESHAEAISNFLDEIKVLTRKQHNFTALTAVFSDVLQVPQIDLDSVVDADDAKFSNSLRRLQETVRSSTKNIEERIEKPLQSKIASMMVEIEELNKKIAAIMNAKDVANREFTAEKSRYNEIINDLQRDREQLQNRIVYLGQASEQAHSEHVTMKQLLESERDSDVKRLELKVADLTRQLEEEKQTIKTSGDSVRMELERERQDLSLRFERDREALQREFNAKLNKEQERVKKLRSISEETAQEFDKRLKEEQVFRNELSDQVSILKKELAKEKSARDAIDASPRTFVGEKVAMYTALSQPPPTRPSPNVSPKVSVRSLGGDASSSGTGIFTAPSNTILSSYTLGTPVVKDSTVVSSEGSSFPELQAMLGRSYNTDAVREDLLASDRLDNEATQISDRLLRRLEKSDSGRRTPPLGESSGGGGRKSPSEGKKGSLTLDDLRK
jgi:hypothetical protein